MATTYKGVNATNAAASIPTLTEEGQYGGKMRKVFDSFTLTADLAANDLILMGTPLPEGALLVNARLITGALGGSCALDFGYTASNENPVGDVGVGGTVDQAADATAFFNQYVCSSAVNVAAQGTTVQAGGAGDFYMQRLAGPGCQPQIKCTVASSGATGIKIQTEIDYIVD